MATENDVAIIFVLPEACLHESEVSDVMQLAFEASKQNRAKTEWLHEDECITREFNKTDCVVFQDFKGKAFDMLEKKKCVRIVGPWTLIVCFNQGFTIPNLPWPIFNVAMKDCIVSSSHLPKKNKLEIKDTVQKMGGIYFDALSQNVTHLVTNSVNSEKYIKAAEAGLKIMTTSWIDAVWKASLNRNVHCNDKEFQEHRCLPLNNLTICSTGITDVSVKKKLQKLVVENGGKFTAKMILSSTDILVCEGSGATLSEKYKAARNTKNIKCVSLQWIEDSIKKGYALPYENYLVKKCTSTPNKENALNPDFSMLSAINVSQFPQNKTSLQETVIGGTSSYNFRSETGLKRKTPTSDTYEETLDSIDIKKVKNAGPFLDGCTIYLAGFTAEQKEKLSKIINFSGATRYDDLSDRITHVVVGDTSSRDLKVIHSRQYHSSIVTLNWLADSINKKVLLPEDDYLVNHTSAASKEFSSPQSKKGFNLLRAKNTISECDVQKQKDGVKTALDFGQEDNIFNKYLEAGNTEEDTLARYINNDNFTFGNEQPAEKTVTLASQNVTERPTDNNTSNSPSVSSFSVTASESNAPLNIFNGLKFHLIELDKEILFELKSIIKDMGGKILSNNCSSEADYFVMPIFIYEKPSLPGQYVTELWIKECLEKEEICEIHYYHQPLLLLDTKPLKNCVITISGYADAERFFLGNLIRELGAVCQEQLAKKANPQKKLVPTTHLLSTTNNSLKYTSALKWGLPIVDKDWLLECARTGELIPEKCSDIASTKTLTKVDSFPKTANTPLKSCATTIETPQASKHSSVTTTPINTHKNNTTETASSSKSSTNTTLTPAIVPVVSCATPENDCACDNACSQVTPVHKIMEEVRKQIPWDSPDSPPTSRRRDSVDTPETPLGAFIRDNPSPGMRKEWVRYVNNIPEWIPPPKRRLSTPLSELKRRLWDKICPPRKPEQPNFSQDTPSQIPDCNSQETPEKQLIDKKLQQLDTMLKASGGNRRSSIKCTVPVQANGSKDSQPCTVGWDYLESDIAIVPEDKDKLFMLSGLSSEERETATNYLQSLGAKVSDLDSYDPTATHLICYKPTRNEKTLSFMAAGKWILHISYVMESVKAERLLDEEDFEFGNPKSHKNPNVTLDKENSFASKLSYIHYWRQEVAKRGYGAFHDMRAILVAANKRPLINVIEAGGGMVIEAEPPFDEDVYATHCLLESKTVKDLTVYEPLAKKGIFCVSTAYISEFLCGSFKNTRENVLPFFKKYYV